MLNAAIKRYLDNFRGFRREVWILALVTFINRAGTMVIPFLSKYLREDLNFSYAQVGWVMVFFGLGSLCGSWLGGKLTDKIGFYKIMVFSLFFTGLMFVGVQYVKTFEGLCLAFFGIMLVADMFRPAMFVSIGTYAKPENRTRALSLVRLAVNLGFAAGPAMGGLIIMNLGYSGLFWTDGISCVTAILVFALAIKEKKAVKSEAEEVATNEKTKSIASDGFFWWFLFSCFLITVTFFQLFSTLPLYHSEQYGLTEVQTGLLMALNGLLVFALEMPIVAYFEKIHYPKMKLVLLGCLMLGFGFLSIIPTWGWFLLVLNILFLTFGEIFAFPFSNAIVLSRAPKNQIGNYMGWYTMSFSMGHILSAKTGMTMVAQWGYVQNWALMVALALLGVGVLYWLSKKVY